MPDSRPRNLPLLRLLTLLLVLGALAVRPLLSSYTAGHGLNLIFIYLPLQGILLAILQVAWAKHYYGPRLGGLRWCVLAWAAAVILATIHAVNKHQAIWQASLWLGDLLLFVVVLYLASQVAYRHLILATLLAGLVVQISYSIYQYHVSMPHTRQQVRQHPELLQRFGIQGIMTRAFKNRLASRRVFGTFVVANALGGYLILLLPVIIGLWWDNRTAIHARVFCALIVLLGLYSLLLSASWGSCLALIGALLIWSYPYYRHLLQRPKLLAMLVVILLLLLMIHQQAPGLYRQACARLVIRVESLRIRLAYWQSALKILSQHWLLGIGPDNFRYHYHHYKPSWAEDSKRVHNSYLQVAVETGLPGLAALLALLWWAARALRLAYEGTMSSGLDLKEAIKSNLLPRGPARPRMLWPWRRWIVEWAVALFVGISLQCWAQPLYLGTLLWLGSFEVLLRLELSEGVLHGLHLGLLAWLLHNLVDFDFYVPGITYTAAALLALGISFCQPGQSRRPLPWIVWPLLAGFGTLAAILALKLIPAMLVLDRIKEALPDTLYRARTAEPRLYRKYRELLDKGLQIDPWDDSLYRDKGSFLCYAGYLRGLHAKSYQRYFQIGLACLQRAVALNPQYSIAWFQLASGYELQARVYAQGGQLAQARQIYQQAWQAVQQALHYGPTAATAWFLAGRIKLGLGEVAIARRCFWRACNLSQDTIYLKGSDLSPTEHQALTRALQQCMSSEHTQH